MKMPDNLKGINLYVLTFSSMILGAKIHELSVANHEDIEIIDIVVYIILSIIVGISAGTIETIINKNLKN